MINREQKRKFETDLRAIQMKKERKSGVEGKTRRNVIPEVMEKGNRIPSNRETLELELQNKD